MASASRRRVAMIFARLSASQPWSSMAAVAAAIEERVAVVGILDLLQLLDHLRLGHGEAEPQARQGIRLAERPRDDDAVILLDEIEAVRIGEIAIGFIDDQPAGQPGRPVRGSGPATGACPTGYWDWR